MPTDRSDVWGAYWDVAKVETVSGGVRRRHEQLMFEQMEQLSEYDPEFDPMRFDSGPRPDLYRVAEVERYELALDFFKRNSERIKSLSTQHGQGFQTYEDIHARIEKEQAELRAVRDQIASRASPTDRAVGAFLGEGQAVMTDPLIIATLPLGGVARGATYAARIASAMASEAAIIAGIEATMIQPQVYLQKRSINSPYSLVDAGIAVLAAGVGGGALRGVFQSGASAVQAYRAVRGARTRNETVLQLREAAAERGAEDTPQARAEADALNDLANVIESTPRNSAIDRTTGQEFHDKNRTLVEATPDEETQHLANLDQAMDDLAQNRITEVSMDADSPDYISMYNRGELEAVDPRTVEADAKRFQFKAGGDTEGVTDRLKGVEEWDPMRAGISVIYEQADGARFIVDGHQRLALAKRLGDDNIRLNAIVLREVDGFTVSDARQRAALKNIAEGTGTSLDAAKVLREIGVEGLADTSLPPQSALVRTAHALAELDQEAFVYVANVLKPEQYAMASIVGQLIKAGPEQLAAIRALVEADPGTLLQARFIVEQIRAAGFETTETMDLFGGQTISETLFKERAKVLDNAINRLKKDKATFRTLVEREAEISGAGNVLEREANLERLDKDEETIQTLVRLANTKGPISEALNEAARRLKNGERVDTVTRDFLATAGRPADEQHRIGSEVRDAGRAEQEAAPARNRQEVDRATKEYVSDTRALHPDDPEIDELAAAEARQVADILEQNPDLEIPVEIRLDADGNEVLSTRRATDVYDDLVEEDTRTTDMFTCMTGGGRG
jgi:outer membrane protein OmpA-like peptidoglycan-associated protein